MTGRFDVPSVKVEQQLYVLQGQWWSYNVMVIAYDQAGNFVAETVRKPMHSLVLAIFVILGIVAFVLLTIVMMYWRWVRPLRKKARI